MGLEIIVHQGIDVPEVIGVHLVFELAGMVLFQRLQFLIGRQHFLELLRLQKAQGRVLQLFDGLRELGHGGGPSFGKKRYFFKDSVA